MVMNTYLFEFGWSVLLCANDSVFQWFSNDFRQISFVFVWSGVIIHKLLLHLCLSHWSTAIILVLKWSRLVVSDSLQPHDCNLPGSSVHGIFQARVLEWVAIFFSRGSSQPRDRTWVSCIVGRCVYHLSHQGILVLTQWQTQIETDSWSCARTWL